MNSIYFVNIFATQPMP